MHGAVGEACASSLPKGTTSIFYHFRLFCCCRLLLRLLECQRNPFYFIDWKKQPLFGTSRVYFFLQIFLFFVFFFFTTRTRDNKTEAQQQSALKIACPSVFLPNHTNNGQSNYCEDTVKCYLTPSLSPPFLFHEFINQNTKIEALLPDKALNITFLFPLLSRCGVAEPRLREGRQSHSDRERFGVHLSAFVLLCLNPDSVALFQKKNGKSKLRVHQTRHRRFFVYTILSWIGLNYQAYYIAFWTAHLQARFF